MTVRSVLTPAIMWLLVLFGSHLLYFYAFQQQDSWTELFKITITGIIVFLVIFIVVFVWQFLFSAPHEIYNGQQQTINNLKDELSQKTKLLDNRKEQSELAFKIKDVINNDKSQLGLYRWCIDKSNPIYTKTLDLIQNSKIVSPYVIECFEEGKIPFLGLGEIGCHSNEARGFIMRNLLNMEASYFVY